MSFARYPNYKDSGVEWLGEVPGHWTVAKTVHYFKVAMGQTILREDLVDDGLWPVFSATDGDHYFGRINEPRVRLGVGDIVIPARGNSIGAVKLVKEPSTTTQTTIYCKNLSNGKLDPSFIFHFLKGCRENLFYFTQTAIPQITVEEVGSNPILVPPLPEQTQIAAFLDRETAKIDGLVAEQRRLMALLKEKRQAVISHAVTRGLNPDAPMKPSGIEWLGDVPEHWHYGCLKYLATIKTGYAFSSDHFVGEGIPVLRIGDITTDGNVDFTDARCLPEEYETEHADVIVVRGDIVMAMTGATIGKTGWYDSDRPALLNQRVCIFRSIAPNEQRYLWHILSARFYAEHIALAAVGGAQPNISDSQLLHCVVPLPPGPEQVVIAAFLDTETAKIDTLTTEAQRAIDLLQERRTALISAAVTGQIDVRDVQTDVPPARDSNRQSAVRSART